MNVNFEYKDYYLIFDDDLFKSFDNSFTKERNKETREYNDNIIDLYEQADGTFAKPLEIEG